MILEDILRGVDEIIHLLKGISSKIGKGTVEDMILQYPNHSGEMSIPAHKTIKPVERRINRMLRAITVSIPTDGVMEVINNNINIMYFSDESGTIELPGGIMINDLTIRLTNNGTDAARFNYRLVFSE